MAEKLCEIVGKRLRLNMHEGQQQAWDSDARFVLVAAGTQSGKTSWGPHWLYREIKRRGPGDYLAVTASYDLFKLKMLPEMKWVFCTALNWGDYRAGDRVIESHTGDTRIILRSARAVGGLESATAKAAWLDEAGQDDFTVDAWEAVQRRLSLAQGRCLFTTTVYNLGWLKLDVHDRWVGGDRDYDVIQFDSTMNPAFSRTEYERARRLLPRWKFEMKYQGKFTRPAGLIFQDYDETVHLVEPFTIPAHWMRTVGVDFGPVNTALVWIAEEMAPREKVPDKESFVVGDRDWVRRSVPTGRYFIYRVQAGGEHTGPEWARQALEYRDPVRHWLGGAPSEDQQRRDWQDAGCPIGLPGITDVEAGIDRVNGLFKTRRLFLFNTLTDLRSELGTYSRELDEAGEPTQRIKDHQRFHRIAALRYGSSVFPLDAPQPEPADIPEADTRRVKSLRQRIRDAGRESEEYLV